MARRSEARELRGRRGAGLVPQQGPHTSRIAWYRATAAASAASASSWGVVVGSSPVWFMQQSVAPGDDSSLSGPGASADATICPVCPEIEVVIMPWQLHAAKQHFSELVERARRDGPQVVTKHGKEAVVVLAAEDYRRLRPGGPSLVEFIRSAPDFDVLGLDRAEDRGREVQL